MARKKPPVRKSKPKPEPAEKPLMKISASLLARARVKAGKPAVVATNPFQPNAALHPMAKNMAMDEDMGAAIAWAMQATALYSEGLYFLGYPYLSELAQRPEYRRMVERLAMEMTRKWIRLVATGDEDKTDKIKAITAAMKRYQLQDVFRKSAESDGFFGRGHIYVDLGTTDDPNELMTPLGNEREHVNKAKVAKGSLVAFRAVEAVWCYPMDYNSRDPLRSDWYKPSTWMVQSKKLHASRLLTFVGREVPDILKPAYSFGGLPLTQMARPYVDNWIKTRQSVSDIISAFSVFVLQMNMQAALQGDGDQLFGRADLFNLLRDNRNLMMVDKETEDFKNVSAPLGTLDQLQAQSQEQMAAVCGIPLVVFLGITPHGLNASSEGELRAFGDWVNAYQEALFRPNLKRCLDALQLNEFGDIDPEIDFVFVPLYTLDPKQAAEVEKAKADRDVAYVTGGILSPLETRQRIASDPDTDYPGLDVEDVPEAQEEDLTGFEEDGNGEQPPPKDQNGSGKEAHE